MYNNKKVVVVTPSGRKTYLNLLKNYILNNPIVDEWQLWFNTTDKENINYLKFLNNLAISKEAAIIITARLAPANNMLRPVTL